LTKIQTCDIVFRRAGTFDADYIEFRKTRGAIIFDGKG
jgi:hypothetical protein